MPTIHGHTRIAFLCFFISHIPITVLIDSQALFPRHYYPQILRASLDWYASTFNDELMTLTPSTSSPIWFKSLVAIEIMFQLPFFFLAIHAILHAPQHTQQQKTNNLLIRGDGIFRSLCLIYSTSTVTTLIPIYVSIATSQFATTSGEKGILLCFYAPYFIFPAWLLIIALCEENVFQSQLRSNCKTDSKEMKKMK